MNTIRAVVNRRESCESINIVNFLADKQSLSMISLELSKEIREGVEVNLGVKSTNIALAKDFEGLLSLSNQLKVKISVLNFGVLLCSVKFEFAGDTLESIITKASAESMHLQIGDEITALIKSSDLSIIEVL